MIALLLALATAAPTQPTATGTDCVTIKISAVGRSAHGATIARASAAHRLIRALDHLPSWAASEPVIDSYRLVQLRAAPAINIIVSRATALVEVSIEAGETASADLAARIERHLGPETEVSDSSRPCRSDTVAAREPG